MISKPPSQKPFANRIATIFSAGFRFYFLAAGVFSVLAMLAWFVWLGVHGMGGVFAGQPMQMAPHLWHAHEMVYGYAVAVMAGFFLTAVPNWTGTEEAGSGFVAMSGGVWILGRFAIWFSGFLDPLLVAVVDLAFIPVLASGIALKLMQKTQARNFVFLGLLAALFTGNLMMHLDWTGWTQGTAEAGVRFGVFLSAAMITIIGGRVIPMFTRNALERAGRAGIQLRNLLWLDRTGPLLALGAAAASFGFLPDWATGTLCLAAGGVNLLRLLQWKGAATLFSPILWVLHAAYLMLCTGYLAYGLAILSTELNETEALHLLAVGAIGTMTLAMMTRAALGHSGRPLVVSGSVTIAYFMVLTAALIRVFGTEIVGYFPAMLVSAGLWAFGFGLFVAAYLPILSRGRDA
ncbi:NnrS family protein [Roseibium sp. RKSG952]|uniref:NnrS family protein n=1 Tax=Roseibium sp. RKSG952 TaxID=2529384 RepID=UPI001AD8A81D|nr:NnrS family protein [Roseibium sp. RKSG952]